MQKNLKFWKASLASQEPKSIIFLLCSIAHEEKHDLRA